MSPKVWLNKCYTINALFLVHALNDFQLNKLMYIVFDETYMYSTACKLSSHTFACNMHVMMLSFLKLACTD